MRLNQAWIAIAAFAAVAGFGVFARPLLPIDETRYLAVAWEMRLSGDWLVPHLNGAVYSHKPPLLFWVINLVWALAGVSETAARLVGPGFAVAAIWATGRLAARLWPEDAGAGGRAAIALAGLAVFAGYASLTMFDAMLTLAVVGGILPLAAAGGTWRGWAGLGVALALGALAKGPVILVHLLPVALAAPFWAGLSLRRTLSGVALALGLGLALVGLWLVPAAVAGGPAYREAILWTQSAGRVTDAFAHARPWWFFLALAPALIWPFGWSAELWRRVVRIDVRADPGLRLAAVWAGSALVLFSLMSGKQAHYLLPALPAVALVVGRVLHGGPAAARPAALLPALLGVGFLAVAAAGAPEETDLVTLLAPRPAMALLGLGCLALAGLALRVRSEAIALVGLGLVALLNLGFLLGAPGRIYDPGPIGALLAPADGAGVAIIGTSYEGEFTFSARLTHPVKTLSASEADGWLARDPARALVVRMDSKRPDGEPAAIVIFRNRLHGVWTGAADAPARVTDGND